MANITANNKKKCRPVQQHCCDDNLPSEFYQVERAITEINNHPPKPGDNGYWMIWNPDTHQYEESTIKIPVYTGGIDVHTVMGGDSTDYETGVKDNVLTSHIQMRSDTEEAWINNDPLLMQGEFGITIDGENKGRFKIGDGINAWSALPYYNGGNELPIASESNVGGIISSTEADAIYVDDETGIATINSLSVNKLSQEDGTLIILNGGDADCI